jgi:hypothetical protein
MYFAVVILLLFVLPVASVGIERAVGSSSFTTMFLVGRWFVFWAGGVRLFIAGIRQVVQPRFTAEEIFGIRDSASFPIVREIGCANLSIGTLGICSLFHVGWVVPAAIVSGLYYGLAGLGHVPHKNKNAKEYMAMYSDGFVFLVLAIFLIGSLG